MKQNTQTGYTQINIGKFSNLSENSFQPNENFKIEGKKFIKDELALTGTEMSFNSMKPNTSISFLHKHKQNEEVYIVIKGKGQLLLNDNCIELEEGSIIKVEPNTERAIRNNSDHTLIFIVVQAKENSLEGSTISDGYAIEKKPNWK